MCAVELGNRPADVSEFGSYFVEPFGLGTAAVAVPFEPIVRTAYGEPCRQSMDVSMQHYRQIRLRHAPVELPHQLRVDPIKCLQHKRGRQIPVTYHHHVCLERRDDLAEKLMMTIAGNQTGKSDTPVGIGMSTYELAERGGTGLGCGMHPNRSAAQIVDECMSDTGLTDSSRPIERNQHACAGRGVRTIGSSQVTHCSLSDHHTSGSRRALPLDDPGSAPPDKGVQLAIEAIRRGFRVSQSQHLGGGRRAISARTAPLRRRRRRSPIGDRRIGSTAGHRLLQAVATVGDPCITTRAAVGMLGWTR